MSTGIRGAMPLGMADGTLSRRLWKDFPFDSVGKPHFKGTFFFDDFTAGLGKWTTFIDSGGAISPSVDNTDDEFGAVDLITDADDNQETCMHAGQPGAMVKFVNPESAAHYQIWFEARWSLGAVVGNSFVGLMEYFTPAGDHITDAGALADKDLIGFSTLEATPTICNLTHKEEGTAVVVDGALETLAADEVVQAGFSYRPGVHPSTRWLSVYEANVLQTLAITKANCQAAAFPLNALLSPCIAVKNVTDITSLRVEWIACGMIPG